jgi:hypothetical protein
MSTYYQKNAPNKVNTLSAFMFTKTISGAFARYSGTILNYNSPDDSTNGYKHGSDNNADPQAMATGEIRVRLPLSAVTADNDDIGTGSKGFQMIIDSTAVSSLFSGAKGVKILLPLGMYHNATGAPVPPSTSTSFANASDTISRIFSSSDTYKGGSVHSTTPVQSTVRAAMTAMAELPPTTPLSPIVVPSAYPTSISSYFEGLNIVQLQADSPHGALLYNASDTVYEDLKEELTNTHVALFKLGSFTPSDKTNLGNMSAAASGPLSKPPAFVFAEAAQENTYYMYCISESGNVRMYRLIVDVYTAIPKYVNDGAQWGQETGVGLETAVGQAQQATTSVDIWVKRTESDTPPAWAKNKQRQNPARSACYNYRRLLRKRSSAGRTQCKVRSSVSNRSLYRP